MSEQMDAAEAGDVLSSIRRLVSEEVQPKRRGGAKSDPKRDQADKLILTPSLRVDEVPPAAAGVSAVDAVLAALGAQPREGVVVDLASRMGLQAANQDVKAEAAEPAQAVTDAGIVAGVLAQVAVGDAEPAVEAAAEEEADGLERMQFLSSRADDLSGEDPVAEEPVAAIGGEALRDLVRDVLREELQGDLGERITRNVRKMVRAEIARTLSSRGAD